MTSNNNNKNRPKSVLKVGTCLLGCCTGWRGLPTFRRNQPISWPWTKNRAISIHNCSSLGHDFKSPAIVITIVQGLTALLVVNKQTNKQFSFPYLSSWRKDSLGCKTTSFTITQTKNGWNTINGRCTYDGGSSVRGHLHVLHPATRQQHHLQVEQVCRQVACGLGDVKAHSGGGQTCCDCTSKFTNDSKIKLYPCCLAIISRRDFMIFVEDTETDGKQLTDK